MGNSSSIISHHSNEIETSHKTNKIPKHLQPLKRKQTNKSTNKVAAAATTPTIINNNNHAVIDNTTVNNHNDPAKTLQVNNHVIDHSVSSPELFRWTKGRRFQNSDDISYPLPNDQTELDRHRVRFYIIRWAFDSRHIVPPIIKQRLFEGIRVLDVGCGPGLWLGHPVIDMAQDYCKSTFDSIDICNLLPHSQNSNNNTTTNTIKHNQPSTTQDNKDLQSLPSPTKIDKGKEGNFKFTCHNVVKDGPIPFDIDTFDYVQQALTALAYNTKDLKTVLMELKRVTKPGGYIQLIEIDLYSQNLGKQGGLWQDQIHEVLKRERGIEPRIACQLAQLLTEIGLINVETRFISVPIGSWGLDIGNLWEQNVVAFLEAARPFLVDLLQVTNNQYKKDRKKMMEELKGGQVKAFNNIHIAYGRIPF